MKYVNFTLKEMTPGQMKMNPIKPIIKGKTNEELDTEGGESKQMNMNPPYLTKFKRNSPHLKNSHKMNILHFQTCQNKILNLT